MASYGVALGDLRGFDELVLGKVLPATDVLIVAKRVVMTEFLIGK